MEIYDPNIEDIYRKCIEVEGYQTMLEILDTTGSNQECPQLKEDFLKKAEGFVLIYSIVSKSTFVELNELRDQIIHARDDENFCCIVVGNKIDLEQERIVSKEELQELSRKWGCLDIESSAKTNDNIDQIFFRLVQQINKKFLPNFPTQEKKGCILF